MVKLTLYSKKVCHLCDTVKKELNGLRKELSFSITEVDIEKDLNANEKYRNLIPVIEMDGKVIFTGRIDREKLKHALRQKYQP
ncbi:MAG: glutaredoxin family protein [Candidatus Methanoperedens sp.]|nr:glutaredoxin family protein [Candidatus Methanoperedens sp.]